MAGIYFHESASRHLDQIRADRHSWRAPPFGGGLLCDDSGLKSMLFYVKLC